MKLNANTRLALTATRIQDLITRFDAKIHELTDSRRYIEYVKTVAEALGADTNVDNDHQVTLIIPKGDENSLQGFLQTKTTITKLPTEGSKVNGSLKGVPPFNGNHLALYYSDELYELTFIVGEPK